MKALDFLQHLPFARLHLFVRLGVAAWVLALLCAGCKPRPIVTSEKTDTLIVRQTVRDTLIVTPAAELVTLFRTDTFVRENDRVRVEFRQLPGQIRFIRAECKPDTVPVQIRETDTRRTSSESAERIVYVPCPAESPWAHPKLVCIGFALGIATYGLLRLGWRIYGKSIPHLKILSWL